MNVHRRLEKLLFVRMKFFLFSIFLLMMGCSEKKPLSPSDSSHGNPLENFLLLSEMEVINRARKALEIEKININEYVPSIPRHLFVKRRLKSKGAQYKEETCWSIGFYLKPATPGGFFIVLIYSDGTYKIIRGA
jgi:hypothetical protein